MSGIVFNNIMSAISAYISSVNVFLDSSFRWDVYSMQVLSNIGLKYIQKSTANNVI